MSLSLGLKTKIGLPMVVLALVLGLAGLTLLSARVDSLKSAFVNMLAQDRVSAVRNALSTAADTALKEAAMFSSLPEVAAAYRLAHSGDMNDPKSPAAQAARERIREILAPVRAGLKTNLDADFKLHYHLPNGRSLVRIWRAKQAKKEGKWVDISDDLSGFRQTVLDINAKPEPLKGIEPGRGGFSIRGLAPVRDVDGGVLGSVEMLVDFDAVLGPFQAEPGVSVMVFMDEKLLNITTRLQDPAKYPVLDGGFVFVSGQDVPDAAAIATPALLGEGAQRVVVRTVGSRAVAAFPIEDYRGRRVGVLLVAQDITGPLAILANLSWVLKVSLVLVILAPLLVGMALMQRTVFSRIKRIEAFARSVAQGDLDGELDCRGSDEMAGIGRAVRSIPRSLKSLLADYETLAEGVRTGDFLRHADASGYSGAFAQLLESGNTLAEMFRNLFDAMPAPVMAIDRDRRVVYANPAAAAMTGLPVEKVQGRECHSLFRTQDCGSERCACVKAMRSRRAERSATASGEGQERLDFEYMALPLTGRDGTVVGALEVVMDQTVIRRVQRRIEEGVQRIDDIVDELSGHARTLAETMHRTSEGAQKQRRRTSGVAQSMEQMTSTVLEVARNATQAATSAGQASEHAGEGSRVVGEMIRSIQQVHARVASLNESFQDLGGKVEGIGRVMNVIADIADQTNLLALNAAIEAARAGDAGRGFAVVADEVRKLAEKTVAATSEVEAAVRSIQQGTRQTVDAIEQTVQVVGESTGLAGRAGEALGTIVENVDATARQISGIAAAAEEQAAASEEINKSVDEIARIADVAAGSMDESRRDIEAMAVLAQDVRGQVESLRD